MPFKIPKPDPLSEDHLREWLDIIGEVLFDVRICVENIRLIHLRTEATKIFNGNGVGGIVLSQSYFIAVTQLSKLLCDGKTQHLTFNRLIMALEVTRKEPWFIARLQSIAKGEHQGWWTADEFVTYYIDEIKRIQEDFHDIIDLIDRYRQKVTAHSYASFTGFRKGLPKEPLDPEQLKALVQKLVIERQIIHYGLGMFPFLTQSPEPFTMERQIIAFHQYFNREVAKSKRAQARRAAKKR